MCTLQAAPPHDQPAAIPFSPSIPALDRLGTPFARATLFLSFLDLILSQLGLSVHHVQLCRGVSEPGTILTACIITTLFQLFIRTDLF